MFLCGCLCLSNLQMLRDWLFCWIQKRFCNKKHIQNFKPYPAVTGTQISVCWYWLFLTAPSFSLWMKCLNTGSVCHSEALKRHDTLTFGHCPSWEVRFTHWDAASYYSSALTFLPMFAVDSVCLSTYSNVNCDCWARAWRPNSALFLYNSNRVQSDKNPNSFNCWPVCHSGCLYCPSALVSVSAGLNTPPFFRVYLHQRPPACLSHWQHLCWHAWAEWTKVYVICSSSDLKPLSRYPLSHLLIFTVSIHWPDSSQTEWKLAQCVIWLPAQSHSETWNNDKWQWQNLAYLSNNISLIVLNNPYC